MNSDVIDRIYECAFSPELWPGTLDELSEIAGARGGVFFAATKRVLNWTASASVRNDFESYVGEGWLARCPRRLCWFSNVHHGFLVEHDIWTDQELDDSPIYRDFLRPRGLGWSAGTALSSPTGDQLLLSFERDYAKGPVEKHRVEKLDELRPHLARSALVSARLQLARAKSISDTLALIGLAALVLDEHGKVLAANSLIETMQAIQWRAHDRVSLLDKDADRMMRDAIASDNLGACSSARSFPIRGVDGRAIIVAHIVPVRLSARDIFVRCAAVLMVTPVVPPAAPPVELIRSLFDLTPAEARIARGLASGKTVENLAEDCGVSLNTIRTHVRGVLEKTGCNRQAEVTALLAGILPSTDKLPS